MPKNGLLKEHPCFDVTFDNFVLCKREAKR